MRWEVMKLFVKYSFNKTIKIELILLKNEVYVNIIYLWLLLIIVIQNDKCGNEYIRFIIKRDKTNILTKYNIKQLKYYDLNRICIQENGFLHLLCTSWWEA